MALPSLPAPRADWSAWGAAVHDAVNQNSIKRHVVHGDNPNVARPVTTDPVFWYGTVDPVNADDTIDVMIYISADGSAGGAAGTIAASNVTGLATVATTGSYTDLLNKPTSTDNSDRLLTAGETTLPRTSFPTVITNAGPALATGRFVGAGFTALRTETVSNLAMYCTMTAAGATPTLARMGVWAVNTDGSLTPVASTANDTTLFATIQTRYTRALTTPFTKTAGQRYVAGALVVTAAAAPVVAGHNVSSDFYTAAAPRIGYRLDSQTDLPGSVAAASLNNFASVPYVELLP